MPTSTIPFNKTISPRTSWPAGPVCWMASSAPTSRPLEIQKKLSDAFLPNTENKSCFELKRSVRGAVRPAKSATKALGMTATKTTRTGKSKPLFELILLKQLYINFHLSLLQPIYFSIYLFDLTAAQVYWLWLQPSGALPVEQHEEKLRPTAHCGVPSARHHLSTRLRTLGRGSKAQHPRFFFEKIMA